MRISLGNPAPLPQVDSIVVNAVHFFSDQSVRIECNIFSGVALVASATLDVNQSGFHRFARDASATRIQGHVSTTFVEDDTAYDEFVAWFEDALSSGSNPLTATAAAMLNLSMVPASLNPSVQS